MRAHMPLAALLVGVMHKCRDMPDVSFEATLAEARKQFNREVREEALTKPLPAK